MCYCRYIPKSIDLILKGLVDGEMGQKLDQVIPISNMELVKQVSEPPIPTAGWYNVKFSSQTIT